MNIIELAENLAKAQAMMHQIGLLNAPTDPIARLKLDARFQLASDLVSKLQAQYQKALGEMSSDELLAIINGPTS